MNNHKCEGLDVPPSVFIKMVPGFKMLDLSTAHLSPVTRELMFNDAADAIYYGKGDYGWFVHVPEKDHENRGIGEHCPHDLASCLVYAQEQGAQWIMFDCDAGYVTALEVFDDQGVRV